MIRLCGVILIYCYSYHSLVFLNNLQHKDQNSCKKSKITARNKPLWIKHFLLHYVQMLRKVIKCSRLQCELNSQRDMSSESALTLMCCAENLRLLRNSLARCARWTFLIHHYIPFAGLHNRFLLSCVFHFIFLLCSRVCLPFIIS